MKYIIYALLDPNTMKVRYIGKSTSGMRRAYQHLQPHKLNENNRKAKWVKSLINKGTPPLPVQLKTANTKEELFQLEIDTIKEYRDKGYNLTNLTDGGEGALGRINSDETKEKMSKARKEYFENLTESVIPHNKKEHIFKDDIECKHCSDCKQFINIEDFIKKNDTWDKLHSICKSCSKIRWQKYKQNNPSKTLSEEELKLSYDNRKEAISKGVKQRYKDDVEYKQKMSKARSKKIKAIHCLTGEVLIFDSALKAKEAGFNNTNISQAIKKNLPYKGYRWSFIIDKKD